MVWGLCVKRPKDGLPGVPDSRVSAEVDQHSMRRQTSSLFVVCQRPHRLDVYVQGI